jgi:hypothetical protein
VSTPAQAATQAAASSHPSVHGELAAQPSAKKGIGLLVAAAVVAVACAGGAWMMFGRGESNARSPADVEAILPALKNVAAMKLPQAPQPPPASPTTETPTHTPTQTPTPPTPTPTTVAAPIPAAPEPSPPLVVASAAHATHRKHEPAHPGRPASPPPLAAAAPVAASPSAAAPTPPPPAAPKGALAEGDGLFRGGDVEGALAKYQEAARANPSDPKAQKMIGKCYNRLGQHDRAVPYLKKYLELSPDASDKAFIQAQIDQK